MEKYIGRCDICQKMKNWAEIPAEKLIANEVSEKLWTYLIPYKFSICYCKS